MPLYEYVCMNCKRTCETLQKMSDPELLRMEGCEPDNNCELRKLFSVAAIRASGIDRSEDILLGAKRYQAPETITRDWMTPDGKTTPMKPGEYSPAWVGKDA